MKNDMPPPGRKLDRLIAQKIFGCQVKMIPVFRDSEELEPSYCCTCKDQAHRIQKSSFRYRDEDIKFYSSSIEAAWEIVDKLGEHPGYYSVRLAGHSTLYRCVFEEQGKFEAFGKSAPHAICLAALKAIGYEE